MTALSPRALRTRFATPASAAPKLGARGKQPGLSRRIALAALASLFLSVAATHARAQSLQLTYGAKGVQTLVFGGVTLEDVGTHPEDAFHIWHMRATDLNGKVLTAGQDGWGENNNGTTWNAATNTETYNFQWGSIRTQFVQSGNNLNLIVTETNHAGSGVIFDGAEIYPLALHFPQSPAGFNGYSQYVITTTGPGVSAADFGAGVVTSVIPDESVPMYGGWKSTGANTFTPLMTTTAPDGLPTFLPSINRPLQPGSSFTYTVSLRFTPEGTAADAKDAYASFAATYPSQMTWTDKRIIGTAYLATAPANSSDVSQPGGFPTNPRRYFNDPSVDVTNPAGLAVFQARVLASAAATATNARTMNSQGVMTWDIEGEQYPQATSYVCSPDQIATVAPEMESTVSNPLSPYAGQKLDDAYFKTLTDAGLKVGVCLRPQMFAIAGNGTATQSIISGNAAIVANLENKAKFAHARWGATMFYVDSTVDANGGTLDPAIFQQLITDMPAFLFIPEESTPRYYAYTAPFYTFLFHGDLGTPASVYNYYPNAFGANLINDVSASTLTQFLTQLMQSVAGGDILMGHADYWQANNPTLMAIYQAAGKGSPAPTKVAPVLQWSAPSPVSYGTPLGGLQLNATANTPGTFVYAPSAGVIPGAGNNTLLVTFTPADTSNYTTATTSVSLSVTPTAPVLTWAAPAAITAGTTLGAMQLNATASVPGTFTYSPAAGAIPATGAQTLTVTFTPADTVDYTTALASVPLNVTAAAAPAPVPTPVVTGPLYIASPGVGAVVSGTVVVAGHCDLALDAAGTFLVVDGNFTLWEPGYPFLYSLNTSYLSNGTHTLQLWGHDIGNNSTLSPPITITVAN